MLNMHLENVDPQKLLNAMKKVGKFIKKDFSYKYISPESKKDKVIELKPDSYSLSLIADINQKVEITDGGIVHSQIFTDASMKVTLNTYRNMASSTSFVMDDKVSIYSKDELYKSLTRLILQQSTNYGKTHREKEQVNNGKEYLAPKEKIIHIESRDKFEEIQSKFIKKLTKLSSEIHSMKKVYSMTFNVSKILNFNIYHDGKSDIVQYKDIYVVESILFFINDDNQMIPVQIIDHIKMNDLNYNQIVKRIRKRLFSYMEKFNKFHDLSTGSYPVMFDPSASNVIFHEFFVAHMLSGKYIVDGDSTYFKGRVGELIPSLKGVDVLVDPTIAGAYGSYAYDAEGAKSEETVLIKNGKIANYLTDGASTSRLEQEKKDEKLIKQIVKIITKKPKLLSKYLNNKMVQSNMSFVTLQDKISYYLKEYALNTLISKIKVKQKLNWRANYKRLTSCSNGHARIQSWTLVDQEQNIVGVEPRQSNLIVNVNKKVTQTPEEAIIKICKENGYEFYLITGSYDGSVDITSGSSNLMPDYVTKRYLDKRPDENINCDLFSINIEEFLKHIKYIGTDNETNRGFCGSNSGTIPVESETPTLICDQVSFIQGTDIRYATKEELSVLEYKNKKGKINKVF